MDRVQLLVGTISGLFIYRTDANRARWEMAGPLLGGWRIDSVLGDSCHGDRIFVGASHQMHGAAIQVSEDGGQSWVPVRAGPQYPHASGLSLRSIWQITPAAPGQPDTYYAGVDEAGLFVSHDCGLSWQEVLGFNRHPARADWRGSRGGIPLHTILIDPTDPRRLWVAISAAGIFRSEDGGQIWQACNQGVRPVMIEGANGYLVHKLVLDPRNSNILYLQDFTGVYQSVDGADSWQALEAGLPSTFGFPLCITSTGTRYVVPLDIQTRCFAEGQLRVYRQQPDETVWQPLTTGLPTEPQFAGVLRDALAVDTLEPAGVYMGTTQGELFYSVDAGEQWARLPGQSSRITTLRAWVTVND